MQSHLTSTTTRVSIFYQIAFPAKKLSRTVPALPITEHLAFYSCTLVARSGTNLLPTCATRLEDCQHR